MLDLLVAVLAVVLVTVALKASSHNSSFIGVALVNIVGFGTSLNTLVAIWTTLEMSIGAVARVREFTRTTEFEEQPDNEKRSIVPHEWPAHGMIELNGISASYE